MTATRPGDTPSWIRRLTPDAGLARWYGAASSVRLSTKSFAVVFAAPLCLAMVACRRSRAGTYANPVDNHLYTADWRTYRPVSPGGDASTRSSDPVALVTVVLLSSQDDIAASMGAHDLASYIQRVTDALNLVVRGRPPGAGEDLIVQFELAPDRPQVLAVSARPGRDRALIQALTDAANAVPPAQSRQHLVRFQVVYKIHGGSGEPLPLPNAQ